MVLLNYLFLSPQVDVPTAGWEWTIDVCLTSKSSVSSNVISKADHVVEGC